MSPEVHTHGSPAAAPYGDAAPRRPLGVQMAAAILNHRWLVLAAAVLVVMVAVLPPLVQAREYRVSSSFMPQARRSAPNMSGLAAQLGIELATADAQQSPQFYVELLRSRELLRAVVTSGPSEDFVLRRRGLLANVLPATEPATSEQRMELAIRQLRDQMSVTASPKTGIVAFAVTDTDSERAARIANRVLEQINTFNLERRQSQARSERVFTQERLADAAAQLRRAENLLQQFHADNRAWQTSARLMMQQERLTREVAARQQVYSQLSSSYEQARIEEVRDTPVVTVIEPPRVPAYPEGRGLAFRGLLGLIVGTLIGVVLALARDIVVRARAHEPGAWTEVQSLLTRGRSKGRKAAAA
jgi:uncharacterized protein involved in exopolysaccharide biosynthesis